MNSEQKALEVFLKLPEQLKQILAKHNAFLAGGSILSGILDRKVNDYDLWFPSNSQLVNAYNDLTALGADIEFNSENAWTLQLFDEFKIQCVKKHIGDPMVILRGFDFKFCQIGVHCATGELIQKDMTASEIKKKSEGLYTYIKPDWSDIPPDSFFDLKKEETENEMKEVLNPEIDHDLNPKRTLKYFEQNLIHISVDAMIQMLLDSKVKIPHWLMAKSNKLWITGWTKDHVGNLYPPTTLTTNSYY
jgi:hypothetical protein